jgi:putative transferase (TIGR04331 family)
MIQESNEEHFNQIYPNVFNEKFNLNKLYNEIYKGVDTYSLADSLEELYEVVLKLISLTLNKIHSMNESKEYWRVITGPWLLHYIHFSYDKFLLRNICKANSCESIQFYRSNYIVPLDTFSFFSLLQDENYNLQGLMSQHMSKDTVYSVYGNNNKEKKTIKKCYRIAQNFLNSKILKKPYIPIFDSYFGRTNELKLMLKSRGKIQPLIFESVNIYKEVDQDLRMLFGMHLYENRVEYSNNDFTFFLSLLINKIPYDIPIIFIESFRKVKQFTKKLPKKNKAIFTSVATHYNDVSKVWIAEMKQHTKLIGMQHGGVYGSTAYSWYENHEIKVSDIYLTWGWNKKTDKTKIIAMFPQKIIDLKVRDTFKSKILIVTTNQPKYLFRYPITPLQHKKYILDLKKFLSDVPEYIAKDTSIRMYPKDFGWKLDELFHNELNKFEMDREKDFYKSLMTAELLICDHPSTTFLEALHLNKPTLLFWDSEVNKMRDDVLGLYENLVKVGILHSNSESALKKLVEISGDIETWWMSDSVQKVVNEYCNRFCRRDKFKLDHMLNLIKKL